jgi:methylenetetrahydrofolate dehydrogenase (NADP+)/methenyltetrahydrofolate cyclohydrolase
MAHLINGREIADRIRSKVKERVSAMDPKPGLAVILVGDDPASHLYVSLKKKACEEAGIRFELNLYPHDEPEQNIISKIKELNGRDDVTGILVQLPLPSQNADHVIAAIDPKKDVDGFHAENMRRLEAGEPGIAPALGLGIMKLIDEILPMYENQPESKAKIGSAVIVGSDLFARPLKALLKERSIAATSVHGNDPTLGDKTKTAGILIVAVGKPGLITGDMVMPGAIVIDVGTTRIGEKVVGDVEQESVKKVAGCLTPVPGGVGPMTVAMLLLNVLKARELQHSGEQRSRQ